MPSITDKRRGAYLLVTHQQQSATDFRLPERPVTDYLCFILQRLSFYDGYRSVHTRIEVYFVYSSKR